MNIDKNLIRHWAYLFESEEAKKNGDILESAISDMETCRKFFCSDCVYKTKNGYPAFTYYEKGIIIIISHTESNSRPAPRLPGKLVADCGFSDTVSPSDLDEEATLDYRKVLEAVKKIRQDSKVMFLSVSAYPSLDKKDYGKYKIVSDGSSTVNGVKTIHKATEPMEADEVLSLFEECGYEEYRILEKIGALKDRNYDDG